MIDDMSDQVENLSKELDISIDIANAVNKSLKEIDLDPTLRTHTPIQSQSGCGDDNTAYRLWNHQYVEAGDSGMGIGGERAVGLDNVAAHNNHTNNNYNNGNNITDILEEWDFIGDRVRNTRRTSMEDIFKVRHYLNPRSSFSNSGTNSRCWVTIIRDVSEVACVVALNSSLRAHNSKMVLCVVVPSSWDMALPSIPFLTFVKLPEVKYADDNDLTLLTLWSHLDYEFCCYLSPFIILQANIDEILLNEEIFEEIDNETCVFLTNDTYQHKNDIVFVLFKPSVEIGTAMDEFLKVYSGDSAKLAQLRETDVFDALNTLFGEAWGVVGRELCHTPLDPSLSSNASILNYKQLQPWTGDQSGICQVWWNMYKGNC